jgi:hypothetical protein
MDVAKRLFVARDALDNARGALHELKLRVFYNKPPASVCAALIFPSAPNETTVPDDGWQRLFDQQQKSMQRERLDSMVQLIADAEVKLHRCLTSFDAERTRMHDNHRNLVLGKGMSTSLCNLIEQRLQLITERVRDKYNYITQYHLRNSFDHIDDAVGFLSSTIVDTSHSLNARQMQLLNRGPAYVPPCQLHARTSSSSAPSVLDDTATRHYAPLKRQIVHLLNKCQVNIARAMEIEKKIDTLFRAHFSSLAASTHLTERAVDEDRLVRSIRRSLKENNLVLRRTANQMNTFYLTDARTFDEKAANVLTMTDAYKLLFHLNEHNGGQHWSDEVKEMIDSMNAALQILKRKKALPVDVIETLLTNHLKVQLPRLCFLPDISKVSHPCLLVSLPCFLTYR